MKKVLRFVVLAFSVVFTTSICSQTYTIISRNNDTILLFPSKAGAALKSLTSTLPGGGKESESLKFLISKKYAGKESLIFVDFMNTMDKYFVTYETDMQTAGKWIYQTYSFNDIYNSLTRKNAINLEGNLLGINFSIHQRPEVYDDMMCIDNAVNVACPIKIELLEKMILEGSVLLQEKENKQLPKLLALGFTEEIAKDAIANPDSYYIAYLLKINNFDNSYNADFRDRSDKDKIFEIVKEFTIEQLEVLGKGCSIEAQKYKKY